MHSSVEVLNTFTHSPEAHNRNLHPQNTHETKSVISEGTRPSATFRKSTEMLKKHSNAGVNIRTVQVSACDANANR